MKTPVSPSRNTTQSALPRLARGWLADRRGTVAIEVGMLAMPFCMLVVGILAIGFVTWCNSTLDFATQKAARRIMTGALQSANTTSDQFRSSVLCGYLPSAAFDCSKLVVNLQVVTETGAPTGWYNYVNTGKTALVTPPLDNSQNGFCMGTGNTYQVLEVLYPIPIISRFLAPATAPNAKSFVLMSTAAFKNEPFQGASNQGSC